jgi:hypothetical protein
VRILLLPRCLSTACGTRTLRLARVATLMLAACGGAPATAPSTAPAGPVATCSTAAENTVASMVEVLEPAPPAADIKKYIDLIRDRCEQDAWPLEAKRCMTAIKQRADAERCEPLLTDAQKEALVSDQEAKFAAPAPPSP